MAERAQARRTTEIPGASHAAAVSHPDATARLILEAAAVGVDRLSAWSAGDAAGQGSVGSARARRFRRVRSYALTERQQGAALNRSSLPGVSGRCSEANEPPDWARD